MGACGNGVLDDLDPASCRSPGPPPPRFEAEYRFLDVDLRLRTDSAEIRTFLGDLYAGFATRRGGGGTELRMTTGRAPLPCRLRIEFLDQEYRVFKTEDGFVLRFRDSADGRAETWSVGRGGVRRSPPPAPRYVVDGELSDGDQAHLCSFAQLALLRSISHLMPRRHLLHAAALARGGRAMILSGTSGRGKSTLSVALAERGFAFLSDEVACLDPAAGVVEPFPRGVKLRRGGASILGPLVGPRGLPVPLGPFLPTPAREPVPLGHVVLLRGFGARPELTPISHRRALWEALELSHTPVENPARTLWRLAPLFDRAECFELVVGELAATVDLLRRLVEGGE